MNIAMEQKKKKKTIKAQLKINYEYAFVWETMVIKHCLVVLLLFISLFLVHPIFFWTDNDWVIYSDAVLYISKHRVHWQTRVTFELLSSHVDHLQSYIWCKILWILEMRTRRASPMRIRRATPTWTNGTFVIYNIQMQWNELSNVWFKEWCLMVTVTN